MAGWNALFDQARAAFSQQRSWESEPARSFRALACLGRHTLSGLLCAAGQQFCDWSPRLIVSLSESASRRLCGVSP
jgi:hypothetical protein